MSADLTILQPLAGGQSGGTKNERAVSFKAVTVTARNKIYENMKEMNTRVHSALID